MYLSKVYFCEMYPTCVSSKLCEFISLERSWSRLSKNWVSKLIFDREISEESLKEICERRLIDKLRDNSHTQRQHQPTLKSSWEPFNRFPLHWFTKWSCCPQVGTCSLSQKKLFGIYQISSITSMKMWSSWQDEDGEVHLVPRAAAVGSRCSSPCPSEHCWHFVSLTIHH